MSQTRMKALLEERASLWSRMKEIRDGNPDSELSAEERQNWDQAETRMTELTEDIERLQRAAETEKHLEGIDYRGPATVPVERTEVDEAGEYRAAHERFIRFGMESLDARQLELMRKNSVQMDTRAAGVGTTTAGGYLVPAEFRNNLVETLKYFGPMRQVAEVITTDSGANLPWPTNNDTANVGAILAENTQVSEQDFTFGTASLDAYMYTSKLVRVSLQLIQDSGIDIDTFLPRKLGERIGRIQNQHFTTGTGSSQPNGLITGGTAVQAATGNTTSVPYALLVDVMSAIDPAYMGGGNLKWMLSSTALGTFRKLVDSQGRPIWEPNVQVGQPQTILGYPVVLNNDLAVPAASAKFGAFGDFRAGYIIRDVSGVQSMRLTERYADFLQVGYLAFQRSDGDVQDASAYRVLQNSAT